MIVYPKNYDYVYHIPTLDEIEEVMYEAVKKTGCSNLCLSGGIDSSLTLHFMSKVFPSVRCFTIAQSDKHPDYYYSKIAAAKYGATHLIFIPARKEIEEASLLGDLPGDVAVRLLFKKISQFTDNVIVTDCIDELDCGYYSHQASQTDKHFRLKIAELEKLHLEPLNRNSGKVKVFVPYASPEVVQTFLRIPLSDKVTSQKRKIHVAKIASKYIPLEIIERRKFGFCAALDEVRI